MGSNKYYSEVTRSYHYNKEEAEKADGLRCNDCGVLFQEAAKHKVLCIDCYALQLLKFGEAEYPRCSIPEVEPESYAYDITSETYIKNKEKMIADYSDYVVPQWLLKEV